MHAAKQEHFPFRVALCDDPNDGGTDVTFTNSRVDCKRCKKLLARQRRRDQQGKRHFKKAR